ncbi:MAG: L,D-transpeptidase [Motilibacteraceae bacterium]
MQERRIVPKADGNPSARLRRAPGRLALRVSGPLVLALPLALVVGLMVRGQDDTAPAAEELARPATAVSPAHSPASSAPTHPKPSPTRTASTTARPVSTTPRTAAATALPARSGTGKRIVVSKRHQRVWLVDASGTVRRSYLVSGMTSQPDPGTYRVFVRQAATSSAVDDSTMKWFVGFTRGKYQGATIGFHDIPRTPDGKLEQTKAQLGTPTSAGCFRQWEDDAKALWAFAPIGTRVVVVA